MTLPHTGAGDRLLRRPRRRVLAQSFQANVDRFTHATQGRRNHTGGRLFMPVSLTMTVSRLRPPSASKYVSARKLVALSWWNATQRRQVMCTARRFPRFQKRSGYDESQPTPIGRLRGARGRLDKGLPGIVGLLQARTASGLSEAVAMSLANSSATSAILSSGITERDFGGR